jgi:hypothetical protein
MQARRKESGIFVERSADGESAETANLELAPLRCKAIKITFSILPPFFWGIRRLFKGGKSRRDHHARNGIGLPEVDLKSFL